MYKGGTVIEKSLNQNSRKSRDFVQASGAQLSMLYYFGFASQHLNKKKRNVIFFRKIVTSNAYNGKSPSRDYFWPSNVYLSTDHLTFCGTF